MRALIVLSLTAIIFSSNVCEAGMSTGPHKVSASTSTAPAARAAPVAKRVAASHPRESGRVHYASGVNPIAAVGGAIGSTFGAIFHR
jgi:hypothetical protein